MGSFIYDSAKEKIADGTILLESHTFKIMLVTTSHTPDKANHDEKADVVADETSGTGYATGGVALDNVAVTRSGAVVKFDADDKTINGLDANWRYAIIYDDTVAGDPLVCLLDPGGAQTPGGDSIKLTFDSSGIFTLTDA